MASASSQAGPSVATIFVRIAMGDIVPSAGAPEKRRPRPADGGAGL